MKPIRSRAHLAFIREQACCIRSKHDCGGVIEPMHFRGSKEGGTGMKPGDDKTIPGCSVAHREQHAIGEPAFQKKYGINMGDIAQLYWLISPARFQDQDPPKAKPKARKAKPATGRPMKSRGFDKTKTRTMAGKVRERTHAARMGG